MINSVHSNRNKLYIQQMQSNSYKECEVTSNEKLPWKAAAKMAWGYQHMSNRTYVLCVML